METMPLLILGYVVGACFSALSLTMAVASGVTGEAKGARDLFSSAILEIETANETGQYPLIPLMLAVIAWYAFFLGPIYLVLWVIGKIIAGIFKTKVP